MMLVQGQIPSFPGVNKSAMCNLSTTEGTSPYIECKRDFPLMKKKKVKCLQEILQVWIPLALNN